MGLGRVERPTSPLSGVRSNQLSYRPSAVPRRRGWLPDRAQGGGPPVAAGAGSGPGGRPSRGWAVGGG